MASIQVRFLKGSHMVDRVTNIDYVEILNVIYDQPHAWWALRLLMPVNLAEK
jgi:hypothetical protein